MKFLVAFLLLGASAFAMADEPAPKPEPESLRMWNPFSGAGAALKSSCKCDRDKCDCCFNIPFINNKGCFIANLVNGGINMGVSYGGIPIVTREFPLVGKKEVCGNLPKNILGIGFCLSGDSHPSPKGVEVCSSITLTYKQQPGATMGFQCLIASGGTLSLGAYPKKP